MFISYIGHLHLEEGLSLEEESTGSTQSYALMCMVPSRSLLKTVIPGWLCRGITAPAGRKKMQSCNIYESKQLNTVY